MSIDVAFRGSLCANDFLRATVAAAADWQTIDDTALDDFEARPRTIFERFPIDTRGKPKS